MFISQKYLVIPLILNTFFFTYFFLIVYLFFHESHTKTKINCFFFHSVQIAYNKSSVFRVYHVTMY